MPEEISTEQNEQQSSSEKFIPQEQVNKIVQERLMREREKFSDYEDLKKF
jgi:hypothetical protein